MNDSISPTFPNGSPNDSSRAASVASPTITGHGGAVARTDRERLLGQRGATVWFTGLSGSGKSTIAVAVETRLIGLQRLCYRIDGDNLRHGLNRNLGFSPEDRAENVRRTGEVCRILADTGVIALASLVSPFAADRQALRALHADWNLAFFEVRIDVALAVAEARDPKGLYKKARAGEIKDFTGIHQPYECSTNAELVIRSDEMTVDAAADAVIALLRDSGIIS